jgi:hypothetical protein
MYVAHAVQRQQQSAQAAKRDGTQRDQIL